MKLVGCMLMLGALWLTGCTSYPRYTDYTPALPEERVPTRDTFSTDEYLRFGLILRSYLGKPYRGKSRYDDGVDCSLFTSEAYRKLNRLRLPRTVAQQHKLGKEIPRSRLAFGDLVFYTTERHRVSHVGIYIGHNEFIHATTSRGVIITNMSEKYWASKYAGARRLTP